MINWALSNNEFADLRSTLNREMERLNQVSSLNKRVQTRVRAKGQALTIKHLLSSLEKSRESAEAQFDIICYCDTNYDFYSQTLSMAYRIGNGAVQYETFDKMPPPPDEYLAILTLLQRLKAEGVKGKVQVITDSARCSIALQMGMKYKVPQHSNNQAPRAKNFGHTYNAAIHLTKDLLTDGCHVEYSHRHRGFINEALNLKG